MEVRPIPGLEHEPFAEVWLHEPGARALNRARAAAATLGKPGLEVWTTSRTPAVAAFLAGRGFREVRRYVISELDVAASADPGAPARPVVTYAERPEYADELYALARIAYADQPGRAGSRIDESWYRWGLADHPAESYFLCLEGERLVGYGYLEPGQRAWTHGFLAVAPEARGSGVAGSIKRAQIRHARERGIPALRTATEVRLQGMRSLNRRLGYRPQYEELVFRG